MTERGCTRIIQLLGFFGRKNVRKMDLKWPLKHFVAQCKREHKKARKSKFFFWEQEKINKSCASCLCWQLFLISPLWLELINKLGLLPLLILNHGIEINVVCFAPSNDVIFLTFCKPLREKKSFSYVIPWPHLHELNDVMIGAKRQEK